MPNSLDVNQQISHLIVTPFFNAFHCKGTRAGHDDRVNQYGLYSILIQTITCTIMGSIDRWIGLIGTECENTHAYEFIELDCYGFAHRFICLFPILHHQYRCDQLMTALISIYIYTLRESSRYSICGVDIYCLCDALIDCCRHVCVSQ